MYIFLFVVMKKCFVYNTMMIFLYSFYHRQHFYRFLDIFLPMFIIFVFLEKRHMSKSNIS